MEIRMDALSFVAVLGVLALVIGVVLANVVTTPRTAYAGTIIAGIGVLMLAVNAVRQLLGAAT
jgi:hypothetical protein